MGSPVGGPIVNDQSPYHNKSPECGFWPNPKKENFTRRKAPWKLKKNIQEKEFIFDLEENSVIYKGYKEYEEVPVSNKYELLADRETLYNFNFDNNSNIDVVNSDSNNDVLNPDSNNIAHIIDYNSSKNSLYSDSVIFGNKCYNYVYEENKHFCSGYFPSFITLADTKYDLISQNNNINNISNNYYLKTKGGKYLKQVTNNKSKYNLEYINNLRNTCQGIMNKNLNINSKTFNNNNSINKNNNSDGGNNNNSIGNNNDGGNNINYDNNNNNMKLVSHTGNNHSSSHQREVILHTEDLASGNTHTQVSSRNHVFKGIPPIKELSLNRVQQSPIQE